ncbi:MAG: transposase [Lachnospiraceae bacterium]|nr:transposase [Lachnospiraceae bacterium]
MTEGLLNLSYEGIEDSIYDSYAMRSFMHIDFNEQQGPDATTLLKFRHMLEANKLGEKIFADFNNRLDKAGLMMHGGTIVDASLIATPKSLRITMASVILKCIRQRRATNGTSK